MTNEFSRLPLDFRGGPGPHLLLPAAGGAAREFPSYDAARAHALAAEGEWHLFPAPGTKGWRATAGLAGLTLH